MKNGSGKNQGEIDYDGEWVNNRPEGSGVYKMEGKQYMGRFKKGSFLEDQEYTVRFEDGALFKGMLQNKKPDGKGYLIDDKGTRMVEYKNGELIR